MSSPAIHKLVSLAAVALLMAAPGCRRLEQQAEHVTQTTDAMQYAVGIKERDDRGDMLSGGHDQPLPPPRDVAARGTYGQPTYTNENPYRAPQAKDDMLPELVAQVVERQDEIEKQQKFTRAEVVERLEFLENELQRTGVLEANTEAQIAEEARLTGIEDRLTDMEKKLAEQARRVPPEPKPAPEPVVEPKPEPIKVHPPKDPVVLPAVELSEPEAKPEPKPASGPIDEAGRAALLKIKPVWPTKLHEKTHKRKAKVYDAEATRFREAARVSYEEIVKNHPKSDDYPRARRALAAMAMEDADLNTAAQHLQQLLRERPEDNNLKEAHTKLGEIEYERGNYPAARDHFLAFADALPDHPNTPIALLKAAQAFASESQHEKALRYFQDVMERYPVSSAGKKARRQRADLLHEMERYAEAQDLYKEMSKRFVPGEDDFAHALLQSARMHMAKGESVKAREALKRLLDHHPNEKQAGEGMFLIGWTYLSEHRYLNAAYAFSQTADRFPDHARALECRMLGGQEFAALDLHARALEQFEMALKILEQPQSRGRNGDAPAIRLGMIRSLRALHRMDEAREQLAEIRKLGADNPYVRGTILAEAEILAAEGKRKEAIAYLDSVAELHKGTTLAVRALTRKAELEDQMSLTRHVADTYKRLGSAIGEKEAPAALEFRRAVYLMDLNREDEALTILETLTEQKSSPVFARQAALQIGVALERQGKLDEAQAAYKKFLTPEDEKTPVPDDEYTKAARWKLDKLQLIKRLSAMADKPAAQP